MKSHKYITIITSSVSVIALVLAVVYHCENKEFEANIMVGVFSSGFLAMLVSIIEYANKRRSTLETFYTSAHGALHTINQYRRDLDLNIAIDRILSIKHYDYSVLDATYGSICFFFFDKKTKKYIYDAIYHPILQLRNDLTEICYHFSLYKDGITNNEAVMREMVKKATKMIMSIDERDVMTGEDIVQVSRTQNKFYKPIEKELNGRYWEIMYLTRKTPNKNGND